MKQRISIAALLMVLLFSLHATAEEPGHDDAESAARYRMLSEKLASLQAEQEFLLFRSVFSATDSKYLILDPSAGKGKLMFRNRVLRTFGLERPDRTKGSPERGIIVVTGKIDGSLKKRTLVFGDALALHSRKAESKPGYRIRSKDFAALYYALEIGSRAYVK